MKNTDKPKKTAIKGTKKDTKKPEPEIISMDMPEVKDIPGQENIKPPQFREMQDVTISSADEEPVTGNGSSDVTNTEKRLLKKSAGHLPTEESEDFNKMALDDRDNDGELLNEKNIRQDRSGEDLDIPGAELDDEDENIGDEDEENNIYSQRD